MSELLISLPEGNLDEYEPVQLAHPKGKICTFLIRDHKIYEMNHFNEKHNSCFVGVNEDKATGKLCFVDKNKTTFITIDQVA